MGDREQAVEFNLDPNQKPQQVARWTHPAWLFFDFWWKAVGAYKVFGTSLGNGKAYIGACRVSVFDRKSKSMVASWVYTSPQKAPEHKRTTMDWYGSQFTDRELLEILRGEHEDWAEVAGMATFSRLIRYTIYRSLEISSLTDGRRRKGMRFFTVGCGNVA